MRWSTRYNRKLKKYYTFLSKSSVFNEFTDKVIYRTPLECFHILEWFGRYSLRQASKIERFSKLALTPCQYPVSTKFQQNIAIVELIDLQEIIPNSRITWLFFQNLIVSLRTFIIWVLSLRLNELFFQIPKVLHIERLNY